MTRLRRSSARRPTSTRSAGIASLPTISGPSSRSTCQSSSTRNGSTAPSSWSTTIDRHGATDAACSRRRPMDVRRPARRRRPGRARACRRLGRRPGQPGAAAWPEQPMAGGVLVRRAKAGAVVVHDNAAAAPGELSTVHEIAEVDAGDLRPPFPRRTRGGRARRRADRGRTAATVPTTCHRAVSERPSSTPWRRPPTTSPCWRSPPARPDGPRPPCTSTVTCWPSPTRSAGTCCVRTRRRVHRHAAVRVHVRPRRGSGVPVARRCRHVADREGDAGRARRRGGRSTE